MRKINKLIVHCSATKPTMYIGVDKIREWHVDGNGWSDVGYHYVITRDGNIEEGRDDERSGAHTKGHNHDSIGICLIGGIDENGKADANFTFAQYESLMGLLTELCDEYMLGKDDIHGHRDFAAKACPSFDIHSFIEGKL